MADLGGIPGQVVGELRGVVADSGKGIVAAGKDIAKGTAETLVKAATPGGIQTGSSNEGKGIEAGQTSVDPQAVLHQKKEAERRRRLAQVQGELEAYRKQKEQEEAQLEKVEEQRQMEEAQVKESRRKQEEKQVLGRLSRQYGGTGEVGKSGY